MVNEGECVCVCMWRCGCCVRACVTVYRGFVMAGFATLYDTSGPSWTSKTTATPPILRNPPYVWVWRCFDRSRSHVRLRAFLGVQCGTADRATRTRETSTGPHRDHHRSQDHRETGGQQAARQPADRTHPPRARPGRARHPGPPPAQRHPARPPRLAPLASPHHLTPPASFLRSALPTAQPEHPIPGPAPSASRPQASTA